MTESRSPREPDEARGDGDDTAPPWDLAVALEPLGRALLDAFEGRTDGVLRVRTDAGDEDAFPAGVLLRSAGDLSSLDRAAVAEARGSVLDVGAGGGAMALALEEEGHAVTALEILPGARRVLRARGMADVRHGDVWSFRPERAWDTVLSLMNGAALAGTVGRLPAFLARLAGFVAGGGQVLLDSTDPGPGEWSDGRHPGELHYQLAYGDLVGPPFPHLLVAPDDLSRAAAEAGLACDVVAEDGEGGYLARITRPGA